jgi:phosphoheptose isomerase
LVVGLFLIHMNNLIEQIKGSNFIWIAGNGGSAATAEHFATDLVKKGYKAIALSSNISLMTMIANDYGYEFVFSKQLETYGSDDDLLVTISCSGTSPNILEVQKVAQDLGIKHYEFEIFNADRDYQKLEDKHLQFAHEVIKSL